MPEAPVTTPEPSPTTLFGMAQMDTLPSEIVLNIAHCKRIFLKISATGIPDTKTVLEPADIVSLQHVSKKFLALGRDDTLWREKCFTESLFLENLHHRRELIADNTDQQDPRYRDLARALAYGNGLGESRLAQPRQEARDLKAKSNEKIRIMANWDPSYPGEKLNWYDEYIARNAPISTSWLQQPRNRESAEHEYLEIRGMGLYTETGESDSSFVVGPLDDGSLCVWDIAGAKSRKGSIIARSKSRILFPPEGIATDPKGELNMISTGVTECVSIDNVRKRAYVAVQNGMSSTSWHLKLLQNWQVVKLSSGSSHVLTCRATNSGQRFIQSRFHISPCSTLSLDRPRGSRTDNS